MGQRSYRQNCALARANDVIGDRWTQLLIRDLLVASRRFNELQQSLKGIGANLLSTRLKDLEAAGLVEHRTPAAGSNRYALTARGRALEPAILALIRWGLVHGPDNQTGHHHRDDWDLLALKALFQPDRAIDDVLSVQFTDHEFAGWMSVADGNVTIGLGEFDEPDIRVATTIKNLFTGADDPSEYLQAGTRDKLESFMNAFALRA